MANAKTLETAVVVALAQVLVSWQVPDLGAGVQVRRVAQKALQDGGHLDKCLPLLDTASALDDLAEAQVRDARQYAESLTRYAERLAANPTAAVSNPVSSSLGLAITERAVRITEKTEALALLARATLGAEAAQAVAKALRGG